MGYSRCGKWVVQSRGLALSLLLAVVFFAGTASVVANGRVEVSKDCGATWQAATLEVNGKLLFGRVDANAGFNAVRWINVSNRPVVFKIVRFNVDIVQ